jgi:hypothetical protein
LVATIAAFILSFLAAAPASAGQAEIDLLSSYVGGWSGAGTLVGGDQPQPFKCRMSIAKGAQSKINYSGRCTLEDMNLSVAGTIAFDDSSHTYQAAMSSNAGFTGYAVGVRHGDRIDFGLAQERNDQRGSIVRIGARIHLISGFITIDYEVEFNNSGQVLHATVPFKRGGP